MANPTGYSGTGPRADKLTKEMRVRTVVSWILDGHTTKDITAASVAKWSIDERMVRNYLRDARKIIAEISKGDIQERINFYIAAKLKIYNELQDKKTPKGASVANSILDSMAKIEGVILDKVDVTSKGGSIKPEQKVYKVTLNI